MNNHVLGYLICSGIILLGVVYHLSEWIRTERPRAPT